MPGGYDSVGAVYRCGRQPGDAATLQRVSRPARDGGGGSAARRRVNRQDRILSAENALTDGRREEDRRGLRRGSAVDDGTVGENTGRRPQDRERDTWACVWQAGVRGGHARAAPDVSAGIHEAYGYHRD